MKIRPHAIRPFMGAKDYDLSREFYRNLDFEEVIISPDMCYFRIAQDVGFYLQKAYVKDWVDNTMIFLEVEDLDACHASVAARDLPGKYKRVRLSDIKNEEWGREFFLHDPSGILWHFGMFYSR